MTKKAQASGPPVFMHSAIDGLAFGVLRREFSGINDVVSFAHRKLHPDKNVTASPADLRWQPSCFRHELLLTAEMPDVFGYYPVVLHSFECEADPTNKDLMLHLKVTGEGRPNHYLWDRARRFAASVLRDEKGLATILAMHDPPPTAVYKNQPHVHIMALARRFDGRRWGEVTDLARDAAHATLAAAWKATAAG